MTTSDNEIQYDLDKIKQQASHEANRILLVWGGLGALCAILFWWLF